MGIEIPNRLRPSTCQNSASHGPLPNAWLALCPGDRPEPSPHPSLGKQDLRYHPSTSDSFLGRASYAASRFFITRDDSGKRRFNASYLLRVLASSAAAASTTYRPVVTNIYRPYRTHTVSATVGNFGSTLGDDAGRNIFHEFWPHLHQLLGGHSPQVLQRVEKRIAGNPMPAALLSTPAR